MTRSISQKPQPRPKADSHLAPPQGDCAEERGQAAAHRRQSRRSDPQGKSPRLVDIVRRASLLWLAGGAGCSGRRVGAEARAPAGYLPPHRDGSEMGAGLTLPLSRLDATPVWTAPEGPTSLAVQPRRTLSEAGGNYAQHEKISTYELVVSRPQREEVAWLFKVPEYWKVLIYSSRNTTDAQLWPAGLQTQGVMEFIEYPHQAFATAFAHHLSSRYHKIARYTIFVPAFPLQQSPALLDMMNHPALLASVQTASIRVGPDFPPEALQENDKPDPWYRSERFSMYTLEPLSFIDEHVYQASQIYRSLYDLSDDANVIQHFFADIGLEDWVSSTTEAGSFAYGGIFGVARPKVKQHHLEVYQNFLAKTLLPDPITLMVERTWLMLFGGEYFRDHKPQKWRPKG